MAALQTRPSRASISSASRGPHSPARYRAGLLPAQNASSGSITFQDSSTSSLRGKRVASPMSTSRSSRS